eukprot:116325_1
MMKYVEMMRICCINVMRASKKCESIMNMAMLTMDFGLRITIIQKMLLLMLMLINTQNNINKNDNIQTSEPALNSISSVGIFYCNTPPNNSNNNDSNNSNNNEESGNNNEDSDNNKLFDAHILRFGFL